MDAFGPSNEGSEVLGYYISGYHLHDHDTLDGDDGISYYN